MKKFKITRRFILFAFVILILFSFICLIFISEHLYVATDKLFHYACSNNDQPLFYHNRKITNNKIFIKLHKSNLSSFNENANDWLEILPHIYTYSAFSDNCDLSDNKKVACIKIVGMALHEHSLLDSLDPKLHCYKKEKNATIVDCGFIKYTGIKEHHDRCYAAAFFDCPLSNNNLYPEWVAIGESAKQLIWIPVQKFYMQQVKTLAVCVRPLFGPFNSSVSLTEFINYYNLVGVEHFYFYNNDMVPEILQLIKFISKHGNISIDILPWRLILDNEIVHSNGQLAHIQDCIMRSRNRFKYVILVDLDEYIVSYQHYSLKMMLSDLEKKYSDAGSFVIPMSLFCDEYLYLRNEVHFVSPFVTQINTFRQKTLWPYHERSKVIVKPTAVKIGGIHFVWEHTDRYREIKISENIAILHHYRSCCGLTQASFFQLRKFKVLDDEKVEDISMLRYQEIMMNNSLSKSLLKLIL